MQHAHTDEDWRQQQSNANPLYVKYKEWFRLEEQRRAAMAPEASDSDECSEPCSMTAVQYLAYAWRRVVSIGACAGPLSKEARKVLVFRAKGEVYAGTAAWRGHVETYRRCSAALEKVKYCLRAQATPSLAFFISGAYRKLLRVVLQLQSVRRARRTSALLTLHRVNQHEDRLLAAKRERTQHLPSCVLTPSCVYTIHGTMGVVQHRQLTSHPCFESGGRVRKHALASTSGSGAAGGDAVVLFQFKFQAITEWKHTRRAEHADRLAKYWEKDAVRQLLRDRVPGPLSRVVYTPGEVRTVYGVAVRKQEAFLRQLADDVWTKFSCILEERPACFEQFFRSEWRRYSEESKQAELAYVQQNQSLGVVSLQEWAQRCLPEARLQHVHPPLLPSMYHAEILRGSLYSRDVSLYKKTSVTFRNSVSASAAASAADEASNCHNLRPKRDIAS